MSDTPQPFAEPSAIERVLLILDGLCEALLMRQPWPIRIFLRLFLRRITHTRDEIRAVAAAFEAARLALLAAAEAAAAQTAAAESAPSEPDSSPPLCAESGPAEARPAGARRRAASPSGKSDAPAPAAKPDHAEITPDADEPPPTWHARPAPAHARPAVTAAHILRPPNFSKSAVAATLSHAHIVSIS